MILYDTTLGLNLIEIYFKVKKGETVILFSVDIILVCPFSIYINLSIRINVKSNTYFL
jgi:hypothetical protein